MIIINYNNNNNNKCSKKDAENILKSKDLTIEIQHMQSVKTKVIPVITGANRTTSKSFRKYLNIRGRHDMKELQKTAILVTAQIPLNVQT